MGIALQETSFMMGGEIPISSKSGVRIWTSVSQGIKNGILATKYVSLINCILQSKNKLAGAWVSLIGELSVCLLPGPFFMQSSTLSKSRFSSMGLRI